MTILSVFWFTSSTGTVGIVKAINHTGTIKFYIGRAPGYDERADARYISQHGAKVDHDALIKFLTIPEENKER